MILCFSYIVWYPLSRERQVNNRKRNWNLCGRSRRQAKLANYDEKFWCALINDSKEDKKVLYLAISLDRHNVFQWLASWRRGELCILNNLGRHTQKSRVYKNLNRTNCLTVELEDCYNAEWRFDTVRGLQKWYMWIPRQMGRVVKGGGIHGESRKDSKENE